MKKSWNASFGENLNERKTKCNRLPNGSRCEKKKDNGNCPGKDRNTGIVHCLSRLRQLAVV